MQMHPYALIFSHLFTMQPKKNLFFLGFYMTDQLKVVNNCEVAGR